MSDGPHKSLPMRRHWKRLAERADNPTFTPEDVRAAMLPTLAEECRLEIPPGFLDSFCSLYDTLFASNIESQLEALRNEAGVGLGRTVIDYAVQKAADGITGPDAPFQVLAAALTDHGVRGGRQIEEHYCRRSNQPRALNVRNRIEQALSNSIESLARQLLKREARSVGRTPPKQQGLDDGAPI